MSQATRLLLVDDEKITREVYAEFLKEAGFVVEQAEDGLDALAKIDKNIPDIIFTGIVMPKMDGFGLIEALRKNIVTAKIPVVILSHLGRQEDEDRAHALGVADFIVRDRTSPKDVITRLRSHIQSTAYILAPQAGMHDADKFAQDMGINPNYLPAAKESGHYVLRLQKKEDGSGHFDAELIIA